MSGGLKGRALKREGRSFQMRRRPVPGDMITQAGNEEKKK